MGAIGGTVLVGYRRVTRSERCIESRCSGQPTAVESAEQQWEWRRWQLVSVEPAAEGLVIDALELADHRRGDPGHLVTLAFQASGGAEEGMCRQLQRWVDRDAGLCDAFHRADEPYGCLAMFQRADSLIVATDGTSSGWW